MEKESRFICCLKYQLVHLMSLGYQHWWLTRECLWVTHVCKLMPDSSWSSISQAKYLKGCWLCVVQVSNQSMSWTGSHALFAVFSEQCEQTFLLIAAVQPMAIVISLGSFLWALQSNVIRRYMVLENIEILFCCGFMLSWNVAWNSLLVNMLNCFLWQVNFRIESK